MDDPTEAMEHPDFVDNRNGNTLARALNTVLAPAEAEGSGGEAGRPPDAARIATAFFNPSGFAEIAGALRAIPEVRLMLGADLATTRPDDRRRLDENEPMYERRRLQAGLRIMDGTLRFERDRMPFNRTSGRALRALIEALRAGNMEVRRYERTFLHAKAYIFTLDADVNTEGDGMLVGSSNLTKAGLTGNLELNLGRYERPVVEQAREWFDELWDEAAPYDLSEIFEAVFLPRTPWEIFLRVLYQLYGDEIAEDAAFDDNLPLTSFQKHGVARALRLIRDTGGAIVADEVGLGKTFIAGELLQVYRDRRQRSLLICPAELRDTTWKKFLARFELYVECVSYEEIANDIQLRDAQRPNANQEKLQRPLDEYQFVVVDEAHNCRNPDAPTRAGVLRRLLFGRPRDLLLLTATPVNNSLWDLFHLIRFFVRQDAHFADRGILSIRKRFEEAMREDPSSLSPDLLYPIIDATTVKRTRQFVKRHYANDNITGPDGRPMPIVFPEPRAMSVRYDLDALLPGFFDRLETALDPDDEDCITFARYTPDAYLLEGGDEETAQRRALIGLLRSQLLKRFESSIYAFRQTTGKMVREHRAFLDALDAGYVVTTDFMRELAADDEGVLEELLEGTEHRSDAALYDAEALREAVESDGMRLEALAHEVGPVTAEEDPKLEAVVEALIEIAEQASHEASSQIDEAQRRKVIVFSFFADTVKWIRDFLEDELEKRPELAGYVDRMVAVTGSDGIGDVSRENAVQGFAPISMEAPLGQDGDVYDLMISTDVLAEGVNLQQCRNIINYDMPWNPMRLVQRHGRIDRIGSPHARVYMRTIFPADQLDRLLNLEQRILNKLAMAAASVGVAAPIEGAAHGTQVFTETEDEIEKLLKEDASLYERGGTAGAAQTGEEYRQTLRKALEEGREGIVEIPWKVGSGMVKGSRRGVFFCAVVGKRTYLRFVPANEDWTVSADDGAIIGEVGTCLRLIECEPEQETWYPGWLQDRVYDFWEAAQHHIWTEWMHETDPANLQPRVRPLNLRVADWIREEGGGGIPEEEVRLALDILESPWPRREEIMLRQWFAEHADAGREGRQEVIEHILDTGLEPAQPAPVLPPIGREDIEVICWMGIEPVK